MNFEKAKALKTAGFPQPYIENASQERWFYFGEGEARVTLATARQMLTGEGLLMLDFATYLTYIPTLEEMIGWCRMEFMDLGQIKLDEWYARGRVDGPTCTGLNAEEAIANLCLLIAKKRYAQSA